MNKLKVGSCLNKGESRYRGTKIYGVWKNMNARCSNKNRPDYKWYGGRGISVCCEWKNSNVFCDWALKNGYMEGLVIDRINNDGNYEPSNCKWVTNKINTSIGKRRKKSNNTSEIEGVTWHKSSGKWQSRIYLNNKSVYLGLYDTKHEAYKARVDKEIEVFGIQKTNLKVEF